MSEVNVSECETWTCQRRMRLDEGLSSGWVQVSERRSMMTMSLVMIRSPSQDKTVTNTTSASSPPCFPISARRSLKNPHGKPKKKAGRLTKRIGSLFVLSLGYVPPSVAVVPRVWIAEPHSAIGTTGGAKGSELAGSTFGGPPWVRLGPSGSAWGLGERFTSVCRAPQRRRCWRSQGRTRWSCCGFGQRGKPPRQGRNTKVMIIIMVWSTSIPPSKW